MVSIRLLRLVSTVLLVVGALAFGEALHRTVVSGEVPVTSPLMLAYFVLGAALIVLGYRLRRPVGRQYALGSDEEREPDPTPQPERERAERGGADPSAERESSRDGEGFDPAMSPLGDAAPGDARAADDSENDGAGGSGSRRERSGDDGR